MRIGAMFKDVAQSLFARPVTQQYPFERRLPPTRLRGKLVWNQGKCTGCGLCTKDCPAAAIELVVNDKASKTFVMEYRLDRCIFCAQCVQNCRFKCLELTNEEWELAALDKTPFTIYYGPEEHIQAYCEGQTESQAQP